MYLRPAYGRERTTGLAPAHMGAAGPNKRRVCLRLMSNAFGLLNTRTVVIRKLFVVTSENKRKLRVS